MWDYERGLRTLPNKAIEKFSEHMALELGQIIHYIV